MTDPHSQIHPVRKDLSGKNTLGLPCVAEAYVEVSNDAELSAALDYATRQSLGVCVLGSGSNVVLPASLAGLTLNMARKEIRIDDNRMTLTAGVVWHEAVLYSIRAGLSGIENLAMIPGTVGAAPIQNIGAYGQQLSDVLTGIRLYDRQTGEVSDHDRGFCDFSYRTSRFRLHPDRYIVLAITLELATEFQPNLSYQGVEEEVADEPITPGSVCAAVCRIRSRKLPAPADKPNAGSFFKNPRVTENRYEMLSARWPGLSGRVLGTGDCQLSAAELIQRCGLKGLRVGDAAVSDQHSLVIVNLGQARQEQVLGLSQQVISRVFDQFEVTLEIEPVVIQSED